MLPHATRTGPQSSNSPIAGLSLPDEIRNILSAITKLSSWKYNSQHKQFWITGDKEAIRNAYNQLIIATTTPGQATTGKNGKLLREILETKDLICERGTNSRNKEEGMLRIQSSTDDIQQLYASLVTLKNKTDKKAEKTNNVTAADNKVKITVRIFTVLADSKKEVFIDICQSEAELRDEIKQHSILVKKFDQNIMFVPSKLVEAALETSSNKKLVTIRHPRLMFYASEEQFEAEIVSKLQESSPTMLRVSDQNQLVFDRNNLSISLKFLSRSDCSSTISEISRTGIKMKLNVVSNRYIATMSLVEVYEKLILDPPTPAPYNSNVQHMVAIGGHPALTTPSVETTNHPADNKTNIAATSVSTPSPPNNR